MTTAADLVFKVLIIGDKEVGKTSLVNRFIKDSFASEYKPTVGVDFSASTLEIEGKSWDSSGAEDRNITFPAPKYMNSKGVLICYDVTKKETFERLETWWKVIEPFGAKDASRMLVGTKADSPKRVIETKQGKALAEKLKIPFFETSSLNCSNISETFKEFALLMKKRETKEISNYEIVPFPVVSDDNNNPSSPKISLSMESKPIQLIYNGLKKLRFVFLKLTDALHWKVERVVEWIKSLDLSEDLSPLIRKEHITGLALETMTSKEDWREIGVTRVGDMRALANAVCKLFLKG